MPFDLRPRDRERLQMVHPSLRAVVELAARIAPIDFMVVEGVRSDETAYRNWGKGRTAAQCRAANVPERFAQPGLAKVTWLSNPLATKHRLQRDGYGHAVDLLPAPYDWRRPEPFDQIAAAMLAAAKRLGHRIRWGADWDGDGRPRERGESDSPHFELAF